MNLILAGIISFTLIFVFTPFSRILGLKLKIIDIPNKRKIHNQKIIRAGGIAIFLSFISTLSICYFFLLDKSNVIIHLSIIQSLLIGSTLFFILGFLDDLLNITAYFRLAIQIIISSWVWSKGFQLNLSDIFSIFKNNFEFFNYPFISFILTIIWITGFTNAINWIDGMDGILTIFVTIVSLTLLKISLNLGNNIESIILTSFIGISLGFLFKNTGKNKIFMGDSGSYFIGFILSTIGILSLSKPTIFNNNFYISELNFFIPLIMFSIPLLDMVRVIFTRLIIGLSPFYSDKRHFHHILLKMNFEWIEIIILFTGLTQFTSLLSLLISNQIDINIFFVSLGILIFTFKLALYLKKQRIKKLV